MAAPDEPVVYSLGPVRAAPLSSVVMEEERAASALAQQAPAVSDLAAYVRKCWQYARDAKIQTVEPKMLQNVRARRGEYDPEKLGAIREQGGAEVYAMLTSVKCRAAGSWIRDVMLGAGDDKPWELEPSRVPEISPDMANAIVQQSIEPIKQSILAGQPMDDMAIQQMMMQLRDQAINKLRDEANQMANRMEDKMEDQLQEGGFIRALDEFIDDLTTFPAAILKGPVVRRKPGLKWVQDPKTGKFSPQVMDDLKLEFERVDPFMIYPSPSSTQIDDGYLIERHRMSRQALEELIGVDGYDDATIRVVLDEYGRGGLREWLTNDMAKASAEGKASTAIQFNPDGLIDALQFWGNVQGKWLIEWGMSEKDIPDPAKEYHVEVWLVGNYVIKAVLNFDPLNRKPYYKTSYEEVPGAFWGNSVADLVRDAQVVMNASARGIVNNMGIASGPQVVINVDRLPPGEDITQLTPWKIWQVTSDPMNAGQTPISFYQPDSRVGELMQIFERFSQLADEYSGIPRYMAGEGVGGVGRTASGMSMLMGNASKSIKQVIANIDMRVTKPLLEKLYFHNMRFSNDPDLKGDVNIVARGAEGIVARETAQVRRTEFLQATANPIDMQIVGVEGRAALLREAAKQLQMDPDKIVPPENVLTAKLNANAQQQVQQANMDFEKKLALARGMIAPGLIPEMPQGNMVPSGQGSMLGAPNQGIPGQGTPPNVVQNEQTLMDGTPITDLHSPKAA